MNSRKITSILLASVLLASTGMCASADNQPVSANAPHTITITFNGDPKTSRGFTWYTDTDTQNSASVLQYSTSADLSSPVTVAGNKSQKIDGSSDEGRANNSGIAYSEYMHKAIANGLKAGTKYYYRVGDGTAFSNVGSFTTEADNCSSFSFINVADTQASYTNDDYGKVAAPTIAQAFKTVPDASFVLNCGDITERGEALNKWDDYFNTAKSTFMNTTFVPVAGNHEAYSTLGLSQLFPTTGTSTTECVYKNSLVNHFNLSLPNDGNTDNGIYGAYYSFDYGNAHFMIINTNDTYDSTNPNNSDPQNPNKYKLSDKQIAWLKADAASSKAKWKILALHKAVYSVAAHINDVDVDALRNQLPQIITDCGIDLVLQGHDHCYIRTKQMNGGIPAADPTMVTELYNGKQTAFAVNPKGTIYFLTGASDDKYYTENYNPNPDANSTNPFDLISKKIFPSVYFPIFEANRPTNNTLNPTQGIYDSTSNKFNVTADTSSIVKPFFAGINISGDKMSITDYNYDLTNSDPNAAHPVTVVDTYAIAKPDAPSDIINQINALPSTNNITIKDAAAIEKAFSAYNGLDAITKSVVTNASTLTSDVSTLISNIVEGINSLGDVKSLTVSDKGRVNALQTAYDLLTDDQKKSVTNYANLTAAEKILEFLPVVSNASNFQTDNAASSHSETNPHTGEAAVPVFSILAVTGAVMFVVKKIKSK